MKVVAPTHLFVVFFMDLLYLICYYSANENRFKVSNKKQYRKVLTKFKVSNQIKQILTSGDVIFVFLLLALN